MHTYSSPPAAPTSYIAPGAHKKYRYPAGYKGIPVGRNNAFQNLEDPFIFSYRNILKWAPSHIDNLIKNFNVRFPVTRQTTGAFLKQDNVIMWLGHASFYICINGKRLLIDPQFYNAFPYFRHAPVAADPRVFKQIDYLLLSHDHADHCNKASIKLLLQNNPEITIITGLNMHPLLKKWGAPGNSIHCMEWYEQFSIPELEIYFTPSRHYSKRIFKPFCATLWGGFIIKGLQECTRTLYFAGDSGYATHFRDIGQLFSPDIAILGIGAYAPRWFMKPNHSTPEEAYQAFLDCGAASLIPMHFQTFNLSNENMHAPLQRIMAVTNGKDRLRLLTPGQPVPL